MITKAKSAISIRIIAMIFAVVGLLMFMPLDTYAATEDQDTQADITFTEGDLHLITVPTISFGTKEILGTTQTYQAGTISAKIKVSDLRGGGDGWKLTAKLGKFETGTADEKKETLKDAYLTVTSQTVSGVGGNVSNPPKAKTGDITLTAGGASDVILTAAIDAGLGDWESEWSTANTKLTVLGGTALAQTHTATITWTLEDTP